MFARGVLQTTRRTIQLPNRTCSSVIANSHCSYCGSMFAEANISGNRHCSTCDNTSYSNPLPVVVGLIYKVENKKPFVLGIRRGIQPGKGKLALIGGFLESGEDWKVALSREIKEEVGATIPPEVWRQSSVDSVITPPRIIISAIAACPSEHTNLNSMKIDPREVEEVLWLEEQAELYFPTQRALFNVFYQQKLYKE